MALWDHLPLVRLEGQVALVTGAGRGIGRAIALALNDAGAAVAVCARSEDEVASVAGEIEGRGGRALAVRCDVTDRREVEGMVAAVEGALGLVDLLVNNAGRFGPVGPLAATDPDQWWQALEVNLRGPLYCTRAVLPGMLARGHGRIVNISSGVGLTAIPMLSAAQPRLPRSGLHWRLRRRPRARPAAAPGRRTRPGTPIRRSGPGAAQSVHAA